MTRERLSIYDTTLRDGQQTQDVQFSTDEKHAIAHALDTPSGVIAFRFKGCRLREEVAEVDQFIVRAVPRRLHHIDIWAETFNYRCCSSGTAGQQAAMQR